MGMPAARVGDMHVCPMVTVLVPHVGGPILPPGGMTVLIGGMPAARVTDMAVCVGPPDVIALGSFTVLTCGMPQARVMDTYRSRRNDRPGLLYCARGVSWRAHLPGPRYLFKSFSSAAMGGPAFSRKLRAAATSPAFNASLAPRK